MISAGDLKKVEVLLKKGADVKLRNISGRTALHFAAAVPGNTPVVKLLVASGADPAALDRSGRSALALSHRHGVTTSALAPVR
jgi:ankyrin repeat protein